MDDNMDYDVFLSHSSLDKPDVQELAEKLKKAGLRVWFDDWVIQFGDDIFLAIEKGLEKSRVLVLLMSPQFFDKEWPDFERSTAMFRDPNNRTKRFIPLLLEDCKMPDTLKKYKYIDYRHKIEAGYKQLLKVLQDKTP